MKQPPSTEGQCLGPLVYTWADVADYATSYAWQVALVEARAEGKIPDCLLALQHPPIYTAGTRTLPEHLPTADALERNNAVLCRSDRGGSITYHGPGQLIGYCIVHLASLRNDVHRYVRLLEETLLLVLGDLGIAGRRDSAYTGVWVGQAKIASIGIKVMRRVTMHGFALNLHPDLDAMRAIVPCGIADREVTSVLELGKTSPPVAEVAEMAAFYLARVLGHEGCCQKEPQVFLSEVEERTMKRRVI